MERVGKNQPAIGLLRTDARFQMPVTGTVGFLHLRLCEMKRLQLGAGQREQAEHETGPVFDLPAAGDETGAGTSYEKWNLAVDTENLQHLGRLRKECRSHENQPERDARRAKLVAQLFGPGLKSGFFKSALPMSGDSKLVVHKKKVAGSEPMANQKRDSAHRETGV